MCFIVNSDLNRYIIIIMIIHEFLGVLRFAIFPKKLVRQRSLLICGIISITIENSAKILS